MKALIPAVAVFTALAGGWPAAASAQGTGTIAGSVTAGDAEVRAFRVKARDTAGRIAYTVYTVEGRYRIYNLPSGTYEVQVIEPGFAPLVRTVQVAAFETATANLALTAAGPPAAQGVAGGGADARANYGGRQVNAAGAELVDFDELYPPHPAREVMLRSCFGCHGPAAFHNRGVKNEAGWRRAVDRMFDVDGRVANMAPGVPQLTHETVSEEEKELIVRYLTDNFGLGSTPRDLLLDPLVRDEAQLAEAVYVQYELDRGPRREVRGRPPTWSIHSVFASLVEPGVIWVSGNGSNSIVRVDARVRDFEARTTEYWIDNPANINVTPHGIVEHDGVVYWVELTGDHLGELDPATGVMTRHRMPVTGGGPHSCWADSRGYIWYTYFASAGKIGRFDTRTKAFEEWEPLAGFSGYGIVVDRQDRVWAVGLHTPATLMFDQETQEWTSYAMANPARRPAVDGAGKVWAAHYYGNAITKIDPLTGAVTEYELPLKDGNPYDVWPDADDNLWVENMIYNSLVRFDQASGAFTYFPFPELRAHTPKLNADRSGVLWFTLGNPSGPGIAALMPHGNVPGGRAAAQ